MDYYTITWLWQSVLVLNKTRSPLTPGTFAEAVALVLQHDEVPLSEKNE